MSLSISLVNLYVLEMHSQRNTGPTGLNGGPHITKFTKQTQYYQDNLAGCEASNFMQGLSALNK